MTGTTASFEVDGEAAHSMAQSIASSLDVDADDIADVDIELVFNGDGETDITIEGSGPQAGALVSEMVGHIDWSHHHAVAVSGDFSELDAGGDDGDDDGDDDDDDRSKSGSRTSNAFKPQISPLTGKVDPEYVEFPGDSPGRIRENTLLHAGASLLYEWHNVMDAEWVHGDAFTEFAGGDLTDQQAGGVLSRLFREKGLLVRRQVEGAVSLKYEYHPTQQLVEEVERLGDFDADAVGGHYNPKDES